MYDSISSSIIFSSKWSLKSWQDIWTQLFTTNRDAKNCYDILPATFVSWSAPQMIEIPLDLTR